jgi:hypothetical protein
MVNAGQAPAAPKIRCRQIADADLDDLADLFKRGFGPRRTRAFWRGALARLQARAVPEGMPRYGYLLENDGVPVGAILLIFTTTPGGDALRANVSSWYVDPAFRSYAPLLVSQALKLKQVSYLNISAARHTWPILEAQGYRRYSSGVFVAMPALQRSGAGDMRLLAAHRTPAAPHEAFERDLVVEHAGYGCISFWCETGERAHPFVFRPRIVKSVVPCAQLIYCRDVAVRRHRCPRPDRRSAGPVLRRHHAEVRPRPGDPAPRRPRVHRDGAVRHVRLPGQAALAAQSCKISVA